MKIFIGADHAGFKLKEVLKDYLKELGLEVQDFGAYEYNDNDDYPDFVTPVAEAVATGEGSELVEERMGIILGGSGQGEAMDANRFIGVRAVEFYGGNLEIVKLGREHNNANILSLGARFVTEDEAKDAVKLFLETKFSGEERHERRIEKLDEK